MSFLATVIFFAITLIFSYGQDNVQSDIPIKDMKNSINYYEKLEDDSVYNEQIRKNLPKCGRSHR
jgi:preprotein translocase subunit SecG